MTHRFKILAVCSANIDRSPTAEAIYRGNSQLEVRSAGTSPRARHQISHSDIGWADIIVCMETKHKHILEKRFGRNTLPPIHVLEIPDEYTFMDPALVKMLTAEMDELLK